MELLFWFKFAALAITEPVSVCPPTTVPVATDNVAGLLSTLTFMKGIFLFLFFLLLPKNFHAWYLRSYSIFRQELYSPAY